MNYREFKGRTEQDRIQLCVLQTLDNILHKMENIEAIINTIQYKDTQVISTIVSQDVETPNTLDEETIDEIKPIKQVVSKSVTKKTGRPKKK